MVRDQDRLFIATSDRQLYDKLQDEWILQGKTKREQFLLAMAVGARNRARLKFEQRQEFFLRKDLRPEDEAMMGAIALLEAEGGALEVLADRSQVLQIAQEFAHGGIRLLAGEFQTAPFGTYSKKFEMELVGLSEPSDPRPNPAD